MNNRHTFVICAYKESPYLEECIRSVKRQSVPSSVMLATSTPCGHIERLCGKYGIPYYINDGAHGITQDWNFAYKMAETPVVTIAHQDDVYSRRYAECLLKMQAGAGRGKKPLIFFSDYYEVRDGRMVKRNRLLGIKRMMLLPLRPACLRGSIPVRRAVLAFGSPICCSSAAFFKENLPKAVFRDHFRSNGDWEAWERISRLEGEFLYCARPLVAHRIHAGSETSAVLRDDARSREDLEMYRKFWPGWAAAALCRCYKVSQRSNEL